MATDDPRQRYQGARERLQKSVDAGDVSREDHSHILEFLDALDPEDFTTQFQADNGNHETKATSTLAAYAQALKRVATLSNQPIHEMDEEAINALFGSISSGSHPDVKDSGYGKSTLSQWQSAVSKFFQYHDGPADPDKIVIVTTPNSKVDEDDMFTPDEVQELRDAVNNTRDRALLELFLNTGQRVRAIQTLKFGDVKPEDGVTGTYKLNTDAEGLKGADDVQGKRPLLGAKRAVADWKQHHPTKDPDDYLITVRPSARRGTPGEQLSQSTIRESMKKVADRAEIDNPRRASRVHNFRHHFVTVCKRDFDMDDSVIKRLIGHGDGSRIMESVYSHLSDEDIIEKAEVAAGEREPDEGGSLTPATCPTCSEPLPPNAKACPRCGMVFTPDAKSAEDQIQSDIKGDYADTEPQSADQELVGAFEDFLEENPEMKAKLLDDVSGEE